MLSALLLLALPAQDLLDFSTPPPSATVLVGPSRIALVPDDGKASQWSFEDGVLTAARGWQSLLTEEAYGDLRLHLEFRVNASDAENVEARGNSGVYVQQRYEVQIHDSFGTAPEAYEPWMCASLYRLKTPDEIAAQPAGTWQTYDLLFRAARFQGGTKTEDARITLFHNDRLVHDAVALSRKTGAGNPEGPEPLPLKLQGHNNPVSFRNVWIEALELDRLPEVPANDPRRARKALPRPGTTLTVAGRTAFVIEPEERGAGPTPWVWYAPTLPRLPGPEEGWMFDRLLAAGIAIAGIDAGESYGSPAGNEAFDALHAHLVTRRGFAARPALLARSRGGLMLGSWAASNPARVAGLAGIYPVFDLRSYPGLERSASAHGLSPAELEQRLAERNPVDRLAPLAAAGVPLHLLHGDADRVVPLETNSGAVAARYQGLGGAVTLEVVPGGGHDMDRGWFESEALTDFLIERARAGARRAEPVQVYVMMGQSNMVGIGQVRGPNRRWGAEMRDPVVSVYAGPYDPTQDYDALEPLTVQPLEAFGGVRPTPYPGGGTHVTRGTVVVEETGTYAFNPGYADSTYNVMEVAGVEVHRREPGQASRVTPVRLEAGVPVPFRLIHLTSAANGLGWIGRTDVPGTLTTVVKTEGRHPELLGADGQWASRDDVHYTGVVTATADKRLSVGCGADAHSIGPELGFGWVLGDHHEAPVVLIKASQGNRSLGWDFLPPGGERFAFEGRTYAGYGDRIPSWTADDPGQEVDWYAGLQYDACVEETHRVLEELPTRHPEWADRGFEVAGFVWWQGHKDGGAAHASRYEQNLVLLIDSLRAEFEAPDAPFVIGTIGFGGWDMEGHHLTVANAQLAVSGTSGTYPRFAGNVLTVETRDFWRTPAESPRDQGFHYNGNAETYLEVGRALGEGMVRLLSGS